MAIEVRDNREGSAIATGRVLGIVLGYMAFAALVATGLHFVFEAKVGDLGARETLATFPVPQIQPNPTEDYLSFRARQNLELARTAWVDRGKDLVHVPIARAMSLIVSEGDAAYDPPDPAPFDPTVTGRPPDGAPRAQATLPASPYGTRP